MAQSDFASFYNPVPDYSNLTLAQLDRYYRGVLSMSFLHPDLQREARGRLRSLTINWPRLVVDSIEDRLDVEGFRMAGDNAADAELWDIWQANDLDEWSQQCHLEALVFGRSFVVVWADPDEPETPRITVESATQMTVEYDPGTRRVVKATKKWVEDDWEYLTVLEPQWIQRRRSPLSEGGNASRVWDLRDEPIVNVLGVVPVVPFVNRPTLIRPEGESEMTDVLPMADAIGKLATDLMTSAEYHAMPRRWAVGIEMGDAGASERVSEQVRQRWTEAHSSKLWLTDNPNVKFGQFPEANLDNFATAINMFTSHTAAVAGLPPHYFGMAGDNPASADALRASEAPLVKKALRKQRVFGGAWERVMRLALLVRDGEVASEARGLETIWRSPETPTVAQSTDAAVKKAAIGIPLEQIAEDLGYTPVQQDRMDEQMPQVMPGAEPVPGVAAPAPPAA